MKKSTQKDGATENNSNPLVSIIIPVYNGSNYLAQAIESAIGQTYKNTEIIVVNDGSIDDDKTEKVARKYGSKIRYFEKSNGGVASALNFGIAKMRGSHFSWLSHDDLYLPHKVAKQVELLSSCGAPVAIIASNAKLLYGNGLKRDTKIDEDTFSFIDIFLATSAVVGLNGCSLLIPKSLVVSVGGFNESLRLTQDYDLWFRLKESAPFVLISEHLVLQRVHDQQGSVAERGNLQADADTMHVNFLRQISSDRFSDYFSERKNMRHFLNNYRVYKKTNYVKTSLAMLVIILRYLDSSTSTKRSHEGLLQKEFELIHNCAADVLAKLSVYGPQDLISLSTRERLELYEQLIGYDAKRAVGAGRDYVRRSEVRQVLDRLKEQGLLFMSLSLLLKIKSRVTFSKH